MANRARRSPGLRVGLGVVFAGALAPGAAATAAPRHHNNRTVQPAAGSGDVTTTPAPTPQSEATHREGDYSGVEPDRSADASTKPKPRRVPPKGTLSWIGFEVKDGGSEVFFQSPGAFDVAQHVENGQLVVELSSLNALGANTWRPIDTHFFDNPLARIEARRVGASRGTKTAAAHGAGIEVKISFKNAADAKEGTFRSAQESDGYYYAYLTFGAGTTGTAADPEK